MFFVLLILLSSVALISSSLASSPGGDQQTGGFKRSFDRGIGVPLIKDQHKQQQQQQQKLTIDSILQNDVVARNDDDGGLTWYGPQTGTSNIRWQCITSDSTGTNLAAGTQNSGLFYQL